MAKAINNNTTETKFNVTFGILGADAVPANSAVLLNPCKVRVEGGGFVSATEFMAIGPVKSTKATDIIKPVLAIMLADARKRGGFACDYKIVIVGKDKIESKLSAKSAFTKWLKGTEIHKSNTAGELTRALVLDNGMTLGKTSLRISEKQPIYTATGDTLRVLMHVTSQAIAEQATMTSSIIKEAKDILATAYAKDASAQNADTEKVA